MFMDWLKKAPTPVVVAVVIVCGVITLGVITAFVVLSIQGIDTAELRQWIQTVGIGIIVPLLGYNTVTGQIAARSSSRAEDNTNGTLAAKDARIAQLEGELDYARRHPS